MSLSAHITSLNAVHLRDLFAQNPTRAEMMQITCGDLTLDFSHQRISTDTIGVLSAYAQENKLNDYVLALISGKIVNPSEMRPALHTALRDPSSTPIFVDDQDIKPQIKATLAHMHTLCKTIWQSGITDVLVLGIGGSYWGTRCVNEALRTLPKRVNLHFLADTEQEAFDTATRHLLPEKTVVLVISKSFSTPETIVNAERARLWLGSLFKAHGVAITENIPAAIQFGFEAHAILKLWPWVGGRYSVWSSVGMPIALCYGMNVFQALLEGAHKMDQHFMTAPISENLPMMAALLTFINTRFFGAQTEAIIPYSARLAQFIPYVQQLGMESLGKCHDIDGNLMTQTTGPIIWGQTGLHAQHSFNQLLHQGTHRVAIDFIVPMDEPTLVRTCLAQSHALAFGDPLHARVHARTYGNHPHNILKISKLTPEILGLLMAFYEHKTYMLACLYNINAFDQFGVELGKKITAATKVNAEQ